MFLWRLVIASLNAMSSGDDEYAKGSRNDC